MHEVLAAPCDPAAGQTLLSRGDAHKPRVDPPRLSAQPSNKSPSVEGRYGQNPEAFFGLGSQWGSERAKERVCTHFFMLTKNLMIIQIYHNWNIFFCKINVFSMLIQIVCVCVCVCLSVYVFCVFVCVTCWYWEEHQDRIRHVLKIRFYLPMALKFCQKDYVQTKQIVSYTNVGCFSLLALLIHT